MNQQRGSTLAKVLLVEDNEADIVLTREILKHEKVRIDMDTVRDGDEALDYLRRKGAFSNAVRPHLILLDLHLPRLDGLSVIHEIRGDPELASIPITVLSGSATHRDRGISEDLGADTYIVKPVGYENLAAVVERLPGLRFETDDDIRCLCVDGG